MIQAIIFDLDDTLLWDKKSIQKAFFSTCKVAHKKYDINPIKLEEAVRYEARKLYSSYDIYTFTKLIGINPFEALWGDFTDIINVNFRRMKEIVPNYRHNVWTNGLKKLGIDDYSFGKELAELFQLFRRQFPILFDDTIETLEQLKNNYHLLLLTNGSPSLQSEKLNLTPELIPYFEQIIISGNYGRGKPDPSIFEHALSLLTLNKDEAIMIGDNLKSDILGSNRIGMKNIWVNRENTEPYNIKPTYETKSLVEIIPIVNKI